MIETYCDYIRRYMAGGEQDASPIPGEHHFVAAYLVPKLFRINGLVPDYINPDGTKEIRGDVVYHRNGRHRFGIEVKLGTVRLTKREFNEWIVNTDEYTWPDLFIGIGNRGIGLIAWGGFRDAYIHAVQSKNPGWMPETIERGYGPMKSIDQLLTHFDPESTFPYIDPGAEAETSERRFTEVLRDFVE